MNRSHRRRKPTFLVVVLAQERNGEVPQLLRQLEVAMSGFPVSLVLFGRASPDALKILLRHGWHIASGGMDEALAYARTQYHDLFVFLEAYHEVGPNFFTEAAKAGSPGRVGLGKPGAFITGRRGLGQARVEGIAPLVAVRPLQAEPKPPPPPTLPPVVYPTQAPAPAPAPVAVAQPPRLATFMVATHKRPGLLKAALCSLKSQEVPAGWQTEILVAGREDDPGRVVAEALGARYVVVSHDWVTAKLNALLQHVGGELCLLADDDDIQDPKRLTMAVDAHMQGADFSGSGVAWVYHPKENRLTWWDGTAQFSGTTMSIRADLLRKVKGWPLVPKGKDGLMARRLRAAGGTFKNLSKVLTNTIVIQHGGNIWSRPIPAPGERTKKGRFQILGRGKLEDHIHEFPVSMHEALELVAPGPVPGRVHPRKVSVLIAAYRAERWLEESVRSVLEQELPAGWHLEVIIGVDGCPTTLDASRHIDDPRVGIVHFSTNNGTYTTFNSLVPFSKGAILVRHDADDLMLPSRVKKMVEAFEADPEVGRVGTWFTEMDESLTQVIRQRQWCPDGVWAYRRDVFISRLGGFQPWPCAADAEAVLRSEVLGIKAFHIGERLYLRRKHDLQLTAAAATNFESPIRRQKRIQIEKDRARYKRGEIPAPLDPVTVPGWPEGGLFDTTVTASLATIPSRVETLPQVIGSLLPQVDRLNVYLNGHTTVPKCLHHPKIRVARSQEHGDRGDGGKFFWVDEVRGFHLTCDDDILYPPDYVTKTVGEINRRGRHAVVSYHGAILRQPFKSFIKDRTSLKFTSELRQDTPCHALGTGVMGFHTSAIRVSRGDFQVPNMADVWIASLGQQQKVPFICLSHREGWLVEVGRYYEHSIFNHSHRGRETSLDTAAKCAEVCRIHMPWMWYDMDFKGVPMSGHYDKFYGKGGWDYNQEKELHRLRQHVVSPAGWVPGDAVLEVGCGLGFHSNLLHGLGFEVMGVDLSQVGIDRARRAWAGPTFVCQDLAKFKPGRTFRGILSRGMSWFHYHLDDALRVKTARLFEWLEPGGTFVLQIATDFSGSRPKGKIHNNTVEDYLRLFRPLGSVVSVSDWNGKPLSAGEKGEQGIIITVRKESPT